MCVINEVIEHLCTLRFATESPPSRTEAHPSQEPEPKNPSSSFDLAIENYLKGFDYETKGGPTRATRL
ncbi:GL26416 [Drosophila persimilis]|uniref:GL26416 n=1 Tax=Drosophila persimilis TaxID=7234 RepID=B4GSU8_DROPE|nr:GL26416 [Drosophila persimilis]